MEPQGISPCGSRYTGSVYSSCHILDRKSILSFSHGLKIVSDGSDEKIVPGIEKEILVDQLKVETPGFLFRCWEFSNRFPSDLY